MSLPAHGDVLPSEYLGSLRSALRTQVFCSDSWQETCCQEVTTPGGNRIRVDLQIYPPGGKRKTAMRRCRVCKRWAPPDGVAGVCSDCRIEAEAEAFQRRIERLQGPGNEGFEAILRRIYWRRRRIQTRNEQEAKRGPDPKAFLSDDLQEEQDASLESADNVVPAGQRTTSGRHWLSETLEMSERSVKRPSRVTVASALRKHLLWVAADTKRRAAGCNTELLPDDDQKLKQEIAHYETKGLLKPRARYQDTVSTRVWYPPPEAFASASRASPGQEQEGAGRT